jgi:hypothetical protein
MGMQAECPVHILFRFEEFGADCDNDFCFDVEISGENNVQASELAHCVEAGKRFFEKEIQKPASNRSTSMMAP